MSDQPERHFRRSETIGQLAAALAKAQGEMKGAVMDSTNPHFKSKYADLSSIIEAMRGPFSANGLAYMQFPHTVEGGVEVTTLLAHASGEWVEGTMFMPAFKLDAHGIGGATTYACRYSLRAIAGVPGEDDDGNSAIGSPSQHPGKKASNGPVAPPAKQAPVDPADLSRAKNALDEAIKGGSESYAQAWEQIGKAARMAIGQEAHARAKEAAREVDNAANIR